MALKILEFVLDHLTLTAFLLMAIFVVAKILSTDKHQKRAQKILQKAIKMDMAEPLTLHPEIDPAKCMGCGACTTVCPEGDILKLIHHKAVLVSPTKCVGHGECEVACPADAIKLVFGTKKRGMDIPRLSANYETNVPGVYIAGELGGMGLIRNAIKQGVLAAQHAVKNSGSLEKDEYDLLIVGAGPAGLAAALVAIANKKKYLLMDQNTLGGAVFHFPRQKNCHEPSL